LSNLHNVTVQAQQVASSASSVAVFGSQDDGNATGFALSLYGADGPHFGWFFYKTVSSAISFDLTPGVNSFDSLQYAVKNGRLLINGSLLPLPTASGDFTAGRHCWVFARNSYASPTKFVGKIFAFEIAGQDNMKLIPALRNSDGEPGMWDSVSKQFFTNAGTGVFGYRFKGAPATYSLRDPHRVAPSGVWARLAADGTLDAVAETELDAEQAEAQGYAYFANTADAAEVLGATEQELV
jgi:hypothetical protein